MACIPTRSFLILLLSSPTPQPQQFAQHPEHFNMHARRIKHKHEHQHFANQKHPPPHPSSIPNTPSHTHTHCSSFSFHPLMSPTFLNPLPFVSPCSSRQQLLSTPPAPYTPAHHHQHHGAFVSLPVSSLSRTPHHDSTPDSHTALQISPGPAYKYTHLRLPSVAQHLSTSLCLSLFHCMALPTQTTAAVLNTTQQYEQQKHLLMPNHCSNVQRGGLVLPHHGSPIQRDKPVPSI